MQKYLWIMLFFLILASIAYAVRIETEETIYSNTVNFASGANINGSNIAAAAETTFTPYVIPFATSNNIALTNGNYQYYAPTNTTTIYMPDAPTNESQYLIMDIYIDAVSFTVATNGFIPVLLSTNPVFSVSTSDTTTLIFNKPYRSTNWYAWALKQ